MIPDENYNYDYFYFLSTTKCEVHVSQFLCFSLNLSFDCVVSTTRSEDNLSCFDYREFCIFDTNRIKIIGLIEFGVVPDPNFLYPPVPAYQSFSLDEKVETDTRRLSAPLFLTFAQHHISCKKFFARPSFVEPRLNSEGCRS